MRWRAPKMNATTMSLNATPRGSPIPKLGNILHSTDQTDSSPSSLSGRAQNPCSPLEAVSPSLWEQTGSSPKLEVSLNIFDPHDVPGTILVAGTTFCQEVHG